MYSVKFTPDAQQVFKKLRWVAENFDQITHLPLTGNLKGVYKLRGAIIARFILLIRTNKLSLSILFNTGGKCIKISKFR
jgi:hypothetical protein